jgi:hypothetical protein
MAVVLLLFAGALRAQSITVAGTITDAGTKDPIPGVNLLVKGKVTGTTTDTRGNFSLTTTPRRRLPWWCRPWGTPPRK